ncbi:MAG: TonB-dependent receptor [Gammaproteobacteria bacterium]|nr:TonB-dependent receptor [Gammaproteobacteria bacterium]
MQFWATSLIAMPAGQPPFERRGNCLPCPFFSTLRCCSTLQLFLLCILLTGVLPARAQDDTGAVIEEIVVIGSHIRMDPEEALSPVTRLDRDELRYQGSPTVLDMILNLPFSQGADGESDRFQGGGGGSGVGPDRATINIRGLGPSRSLVLINGRRTTWSPIPIGADTQLLVDVNMLPFIALENIDFLRDGAAASYGSDAIAGVMNFQTRNDFTGMELSANHKIIEDSGGDTEFGFIGGFDVAGGRGHITTSASGIRRSELEIYQRGWALRPYAENPKGGWSSTGRPATFVPGMTTDVNTHGIIDPNCAALGGAPTDNNKRCRFQYTPFDNLVEKTRRWQSFTEAFWDLNDAVTLSAEFLYSESSVPDWNTSPSYPPNRVIAPDRSLRANNPALVDMAMKHPDLYGPYAYCDDKTRCRWSGDAWDSIGWVLGRSFGQDGPLRAEPVKSKLTRGAIGLDGQFGNLDFTTSATWSSSSRRIRKADVMSYRDKRALQGLGGIECEQEVPNQYVDGRLEFDLETLQQQAGRGNCMYWSPFSNGMYGAHPQVPDAQYYENPDFNPDLDNRRLFDYLLTERITRGKTSLLVLEGIVSGPAPFRLMDNEIDFALGAQWRRETFKNGPIRGALNDGNVNPCPAGPGITNCPESERSGLFGYLPPQFTVDEARDIYSVFGELHVPFGYDIDTQVSLRYEDYGAGTGASLDPKVVLHWHMSDNLVLRGSASTAFRGPTLNQTVSGNSVHSLRYVAATGAFKSLIIKGNPGLDPESAVTFNVGLVLDQDNLLTGNDDVSFSLDYWSYRFSDPLVVEPFPRVLELACPGGDCDAGDPAYLQRIRFGKATSLANLQAIEVNIVNGPDIDTDGIDFSGRYRFPAGPGDMELKVSGTRILSFDIDSWELGASFNALGRLNYETPLARTLTEWKVLWHMNYAWRDINLRYAAKFVNGYDNIEDNIKIDALITHDLHLNWAVKEDRLNLWATLLNFTDEDPPYAGEDMNYDAFTHNPLGRIFKLGFTYSF